jgi:hypothetical protein
MVHLSQSHDGSFHVLDTKCPLAVLDSCWIGRQHLNYLDSVLFSDWRLVQPPMSGLPAFSCKLEWPGSILLICWLVMCLASMKGFERHLNFRHSDWRYTLIYAHMTSLILPTCDMSLGSLTLAMPEGGAFVELLKPYTFTVQLFVIFHL